MDNQTGLSPLPPQVQPMLTFGAALLKAVEGQKITRKEWNNTDYGFIKDSFLAIHKNGVDFAAWQVNDADILATDWMVVNA